MKNFIRIATLASLPALLTACADAPVENKRAPGEPGEKTYQIQVGRRWIDVTERDWDHCEMFEPFPACRTSTDR